MIIKFYTIFLSLFLLLFMSSMNWADTTIQIAPGVTQYRYDLVDPNVIHAVRFERSYHEYELLMGFPQGKRDYTGKQPVNQIVSYYNYSGQTVIAAVNAAFFGSGKAITGALASGGNYIQTPNNSRDAFIYSSGQIPLIRSSLNDNGGRITFANGLSTTINLLNLDRTSSTIACYTPDWGPSSGSTVTGVEVIIDGIQYPMRGDKEISGIVTAIRTGSQSLNNTIPTNGMVLSSRDDATTILINNVNVGDRVKILWNIGPNILNNADLISTGGGWILNNGTKNTSNWLSYDSATFWGVRHPRTAIAWNDLYIWLITIDGRQSGYSRGMTFDEMANFFLSIGATDAINLDGGGSTTMVINGAVVNCPSDNATTPCTGTARSVANAIMLVYKDRRTQFPISDNFTSSGRSLKWDDKFVYSEVTSFSPSSPGGDGNVLVVKDTTGGYDSIRVGDLGDKNYWVESHIYCEWRPMTSTTQYERVGIFARDDGHMNFDASSSGTNVKGGNCYFLTFDTNTGWIRAGKTVNGTLSTFTAYTAPTTAWRKFRIECDTTNIKYFVDAVLIADVTDNSHSAGYFGIGYHEFFSSNANILGTRADNFNADIIGTKLKDWMIYR